MKLKTLVAAVLAGALAPFARGAVTISSPADYATVTVMPPVMRDFRSTFATGKKWSLVSSSTLGSDQRVEWETACHESQSAVALAWSGTGSTKCTVKVYRVKDGKEVFSTTSTTGKASFPDAEIGRNYRWTVTSGSTTAEGHFYVNRIAPRMMNSFSGIGNSRDLGGWTTDSGKVVRQGLVFRCEEWDFVDSATGLYKDGCTPKPYWSDTVGVNLDIDLRAKVWVNSYYMPANDSRAALDRSPLDLGKYIRRFRTEDAGTSVGAFPGAAGFNAGGKVSGDSTVYTADQFKRAIAYAVHQFGNRSNYPILFHCSQGKDRTGALAYLLSGLLGVSEDDRDLDFVFTYAWDAGEYKLSKWDMDTIRDTVKACSGATFKDKCLTYVKNCYAKTTSPKLSATDAENDIATFRAMMLEDPEEAATDPSGGGGDEESFVYENYYWMRDGGGSTLSDGKSYWYKDPDGRTKWPTDQQNIVNNPNAAVYLWPTAAHPYAYPAAGDFMIGKLVSRNPYGGSVGLGNTPKGHFTNAGHGVTDRPLWTHQSGVAGAERLRVYLDEKGSGNTGSVQIWTNARLNLSAFESKNENVYLDFPAGKCDGATVCFYDMNGSQAASTVAWIQGGQAGTAQNLIVSNALLTVQRADKTSGVAGALNLEFALGPTNKTSSTMMTVKGGFKMNAGSTIRVNAGGKPAGTYKLLTVGSGKTLTVPTATVSGVKVVGCASGLAGTVALSGTALTLTIAKATDPQPVVVPEPVPTEAFDAAHTIICYGDSLTWGECATEITMDGRSNFFEGRLAGVAEVPESYPYWLSGMIPSSYNVINQARSGSQACNITSWSGDQPVTVKRAFTLPAVGSVSVSTNFVFKNGPWGEWGGWASSTTSQDTFDRWAGFVTPIFPLMEPYDADQTRYSITGTLGGRHVRLQGLHPTNITVTVFGSGTAKTVAAGSEFVPDNELVSPYKDAIRVICAGANDANDKSIGERYATKIKPLLQAFAAKGGKYLIVSPSVNTGSAAGTSATAIEQQMASDFGDHYLNLRLRMENDAKATAKALGVSFTGSWKSTDGTGLKAADGTHFNSKGYKVMAEFIRQKLAQLNYISSEVPHVHNWSAWTVQTAATKSSAGRATRTCADCGETEGRTLPQKWDYLETDSAGYLGTGYVPNLKTTEVAFDVRFPDGTSTSGGNALCCANAYVAYLLGERTVWPADYENALNLSLDPNKVDYYNCARLVDPTAACGPSLPVITDTESRHALRFCGNQATVDGTDYTGAKAATDAKASSSLMLFAAKQAVKSQTSYGMMRKFVYGVTIRENGVLVRNYRPALDANGRATLFDDVTLTYATGYDNAGFGVDNDSGAEPEPIHEHSWGDWTVQTAATKTADGRAKRSCSCGATEERALPKRWDYLETDASGYLGTGYVPNLKKTEVAFDVRFPDGTSTDGGNALCCANAYVAYLLGERTDWPSDYENALNLSHDPTKVDYYNCARLVDPEAACGPAIPVITDTESRHALGFCGNQATVDGATYTGAKAATDAAASSSLMLFAAKQAVKSQVNYGKMRKFVYGVTIKENGELVRSYRPALNENGDATLFDDVTLTYAQAFDAGGFKAVNESGSVDPEEYGVKDTKAATYVWKSGVSGPWHHTTSWTSATGTYGIPNHATYATASFPASLAGGETVTISGNHFVKALDFANTTALTVDFAGGLLTAPTCAVGREGPTTLAFSGATPELVLTKANIGRDNVIGNGADAATQATLRFTLPAGGWATPPIRTTGNDAPLFLGIGTKLVIDATAMAAPSGNAEVTNVLISATDGVRFFNADPTDTLIPDSLYEAAEITCGEDKKGLLKTVDGNVAFILRNAAWRPEDVPQPENPDIYLLLGQSNMAGNGEGDCDAVATDRIVKWDSENERWIPATDPLVSDAKVGLGCSFARNLADRETDKAVALINVAVGGTSLDQWQKGGVFYARAVSSVQTALAKGGALKGILWHQGCEDTRTAELAESYAARLATLVADLRADLGDVPFVCGELGQFLDANLWGYVEWRTVNAQLAAAATAIPNAALVSSEGLAANGDNVHFTAAAQRTFGVRYADAMWALQHPDVPPGPTPGELTTNAMKNASWGYEIRGLGTAGNEVALVYTNASEGANMSWSVPTGVSSFDFLVVGGGGAGGTYYAGGGGAGGMVTGRVTTVIGGQAYAIAVGAGGLAQNGQKSTIDTSKNVGAAGNKGGDSSIRMDSAYVIAYGGGGGGAINISTSYVDAEYVTEHKSRLYGGSIGGAGYTLKPDTSVAPTKGATEGLAVEGFAAYGNKSGTTGNGYNCGGGGGAGGAGSDGYGSTHPDGTSAGGVGLMCAITGSEVYYAGGGAGAGGSTAAQGPGGLGGGGDVRSSGTDGLGGGGGAGGKNYTTMGGNGGSGVVVIRYVDPGVQPAEPELKPSDGKATADLKAKTQAEAEAEAAKIAIRSPNTAIVSDETYATYFKKTVALDEQRGVWTVTAVLDPEQVTPEIVADEETPAVVIGEDGALTVNVKAKPGLYYGVKAASSLEALKTATVPGFTPAEKGGNLQLSASQPEQGATSQFCVVVVSATDGD